MCHPRHPRHPKAPKIKRFDVLIKTSKRFTSNVEAFLKRAFTVCLSNGMNLISLSN
jgi:hypothetical protein